MEYRAARGMRDVLPAEIPHWERLESEARRLARAFGFREIRPPLLEETQLFIRSVGEVTDIVEKEMFSLEKGDGSLSLRPEATAGIARAYLQAASPRPRRCRSSSPSADVPLRAPAEGARAPVHAVRRRSDRQPRSALDAELVHMAAQFFERLGIEGIEVRLNSLGDGDDRERYRDAVREYVRPQLAERCDLCRSRFERNVLRVLDCKNPHCIELAKNAPKILDFLGESNRAHFDAVRRHLERLGRPTAVDPGIVRGLDYYTRTIFELHYPKLGARSALCGGGATTT
jgi:histidyl-tRNA synthetase